MKSTTLFFLLLVNFSFAQLIGNDLQKVKMKADTSSSFYAEVGYFSVSHTLKSNPDFLNKPLGERANEKNTKLWSYTLGMVSPIARHFYFDGGLSFIQNGEQYSWNSATSDSTFNYKTKYRYLGMPLQLKFQSGKDFQYFVSAGVVPQMYMGYLQSQNWKDSLGGSHEAKVKQFNNINSFVLSAVGTAGIVLNFQSGIGLRLTAQYRRQITDTYGEYNGYLHKTTAVGFTFGLTRKF